jgi:hypothetical protein
MSDETLEEIIGKDIEIEAKIVISTTVNGNIYLLLTRNIKGEIDFLTRHFTVTRKEKTDKQISDKVTRYVNEYINTKKNEITNIEVIRKNKGNLKKFVIDCLVTVKNDKSTPNKSEGFMSLADVTRKPYRKSMSLVNTLVYFTETNK